MADIKITALNEILYAGLAAGDVFAIDDIDAPETKKVTIAEVKKYATENRGIGTNVAGAFVLTDSTQTLTGKTLTSPKINEDVAVTATASEINKLAGCTSSTAELNKLTGLLPTVTELNYVDGVTGAIQTQLNALGALVETTTSKTYTYSLGFSQGTGETTKAITQATILTGISLSSAAYIIDRTSLIISLHIVQSGIYAVVSYEGGGVKYQYTTQTDAGQPQLDTITFSGLQEGKEYNVTITLKVNERAGV